MDTPNPPRPEVPPLPAPSGASSNQQINKIIDSVKDMKNPASLKVLGFQGAAIAVIGVIMALCYLLPLNALSESTSSSLGYFDFSSQLHSFESFILLVGVALGGGLHVAGSGMDGGEYGEISMSLSIVSITTMLAIAAVNYFIVRRLSHGKREKTWKRAALVSGLNALALALVFLLITLFGKIDVLSGDSMSLTIAPRASGVFFTILLLVFCTQFFALTPRRMNGSSPWAIGLRESITVLVLVVVLFAAIGLLLGIIGMDEDIPASVALILLPVLGTLGLYLGALGFFGSLAPNVSGAASFATGDLDDFVPNSVLRITEMNDGRAAWIFVATAVVIIFSALFLGVRRTRTAASFNGSRVWQLPLISLALWMVLSWLSNYSVKGEVTVESIRAMRGSLSFGITWYSVIFLALGAALISVLAEVLPLQVYRFAPGLLSVIGGRQATTRWISGTDATADPQPETTQPAAPSTDDTIVMQAPAAPSASSGELTTVAPAATPPAEPAPLLAPASAASKKRAKALGFSLLGAAVIVGLGFGAVAYLNSQRKPEAEVKKYLTLLEEGQVTEASKFVNPGVDNNARALLTDEALANDSQRLVVENVQLQSKDDNFAIVSASYSINGERHNHTFSVDRGEKEYGLLDTWVLNDPLIVPVKLTSDTSPTLMVGKTSVELSPEVSFFGEPSSFSGSFYAYPGIYQVSAPKTDYLSSEVQELRVNGTSDEMPSASIETATTQALNDLVLKEVQNFSSACVKVSTNLNEACPTELQSTDLASFSVKSHADSVELDGLTSFKSSKATFKYKHTGSDSDTQETSQYLSGSIMWEGDKPTVQVTDSSWW